ncbi:nuclear transport factor 2 family protein [Rhodocytophaga rosea]|uniref:Nuclear transport factor 2 family protein n=1 Tax=Rhodocytophaga rosea TaxID=2704465 RepID=A0A6C0GP39_9BACT|nr:nuclear transport factor 2 family protein [Rhodocytophaga rosea]QHT69697.1 nuclear transport factor 2 family protein [Rhodocytophaga rosea]
MQKTYFILLSFLLCSALSIAQTSADRKEILRVLDEQTTSWNQGNLEKFMEGYWTSDSLRFIGKNGITYGYKQTLENYKTRYPDKDSRGTLRFEILSTEFISKDAAFVIGKFFLTRPVKGDASGHFTLLWRKIGGKWLIVADHSS